MTVTIKYNLTLFEQRVKKLNSKGLSIDQISRILECNANHIKQSLKTIKRKELVQNADTKRRI